MKKVFVIVLALLIALSSLVVFAYAANDIAKNGITKIEELDGKTLGVQTGVLYEDLIKEDLPKSAWMYYKMPNDMILALEAKVIDSYLIEEVGYFAQKYEHPELVRLEEPVGYCDFAVIVGNRNGNQKKLEFQINEFIQKRTDDGWLGNLYDYWVKNWNQDCKISTIPKTTGENGEIVIAIEGGYEPFSFEANGQFEGYDVEFMMNFCAEYGYSWRFEAMEFDAIAVGVLSDKYDFGMNIVVDEERQDASVLSTPYYRCDIVFVLEGEYDDGLTFFQRIGNSFTKTFIKDNRWRLFVQGIGETMLITVASIILGTALGFLVYMACRHGNKLANGLTTCITSIVEGMPTVVFLMILMFVVFKRSSLDGTWISIIGFTLIFGCNMYDMLCVGCDAIPKGQTEASRALGYSDKQSFFKIILPQAARHFLPIYKNDVVSLIKETSVVGYIAVMDLTKMGDLVRSRTYEAFFALMATAIIYFILETVLSFIVSRIQIQIDPKRRSKEKILSGIDEDWQ